MSKENSREKEEKVNEKPIKIKHIFIQMGLLSYKYL